VPRFAQEPRTTQRAASMLCIPAGSSRPPQVITSEVTPKLDRCSYAIPCSFPWVNHAANDLGIPCVSQAQRDLG
jgi:hypothetical protein